MNVISINAGLPRNVEWRGQIVQTSIFKEPVAGTVKVRRLNIDGDQQSDLTVHGGVDKAVYMYPSEHYPFWDAVRNNKPYNELEYGAKSTMTAIMGRMATYSGKVLTWDQVMKSEVNLAPESYAWDAAPQPKPDANGKYPVPMPGDPAWVKKVV